MLQDEINSSELSDQGSIFSHLEYIKKLLHENELEEAKKAILELHQADLADLIDSLSNENVATIFSLIENDFSPELLVLLSSKSILLAIQHYGSNRLAEFVGLLSVIDAIEFMDELDDGLKSEILELLPEENRLHILEGFNYPEHTAGRVMSKKYILFYEHWTVGQAIDSIRKNDDIPEEFHAVVVVNSKNKPIGTVTLSKVLKENRTVQISQIMNEDIKIADTNTSLSDLSYIFKHYALTVVPVINKAGKLVGTISIDNMIFIIEEQAEDAILHFGGV
ncbi:MAG: CBS domain-containing protein, partial [Rickettsiaceae bacterium]|nr:CBS domain-containing protein [Rickettsiaceae bacterium]